MENTNDKCDTCNGSGTVGSPPDQFHPCDCTYAGAERATEAGTPAKAAMPKHDALVKRSEWDDAKAKRQSFNGWRQDYDDCDMKLYTEETMRAALDARAEEARREWEEEADRVGQENHILRTQMAKLHEQLAAAQRTAGGDAVAAMERAKKLPVWDSIDHRLHVELDTIFKALAAQPVAEAAAQADDVPFGIYVERNDGTSEFQRTGKAFQPSACGGLAWTLYTRAAPTAQPTPPDDEMSDEQIDDIARKHGLDGSMCAMPRQEYWRAFARYLLAAALRQPGALPDEAEDAARWRFIVEDGKRIKSRFTLWEVLDNGKCRIFDGDEYNSVIDAARARQDSAAADKGEAETK